MIFIITRSLCNFSRRMWNYSRYRIVNFLTKRVKFFTSKEWKGRGLRNGGTRGGLGYTTTTPYHHGHTTTTTMRRLAHDMAWDTKRLAHEMAETVIMDSWRFWRLFHHRSWNMFRRLETFRSDHFKTLRASRSSFLPFAVVPSRGLTVTIDND